MGKNMKFDLSIPLILFLMLASASCSKGEKAASDLIANQSVPVSDTGPAGGGSSADGDGTTTSGPGSTPVVVPTTTPSPAVTPAPVVTPAPTPDPTPAPVVTPAPTPAPVVTPVPTPDPTPTPVVTPTPVITPVPTPTPVVTPTPTPVPTPDPTPVPEPTPTPGVGQAQVIIGNFEKARPLKGERIKRDSPGYEQSGDWTQSSLPGYRGSISRYSLDPRAEVSYRTRDLSGRYCVSVFRVTHPNSIDRARYELAVNGKPREEYVVNHALPRSSSGWFPLGVHSFEYGDEVSLELSRHGKANRGYLRADEVRFSRLRDGHDCEGKTYRQIKKSGIIDNLEDEGALIKRRDTAGYRESGAWYQSTLAGYRSISRYSSDIDAEATYTAQLSESQYCISVYRVTHPNSTREAKWSATTLTREKELLSVVLNHNAPEKEKGWVDIGTIEIKPEELVQVKLEFAGDTNKFYMRADAVRFQAGACRRK